MAKSNKYVIQLATILWFDPCSDWGDTTKHEEDFWNWNVVVSKDFYKEHKNSERYWTSQVNKLNFI